MPLFKCMEFLQNAFLQTISALYFFTFLCEFSIFYTSNSVQMFCYYKPDFSKFTCMTAEIFSKIFVFGHKSVSVWKHLLVDTCSWQELLLFFSWLTSYTFLVCFFWKINVFKKYSIPSPICRKSVCEPECQSYSFFFQSFKLIILENSQRFKKKFQIYNFHTWNYYIVNNR